MAETKKVTPEIVAVWLLRTQVGLDGNPQTQDEAAKDCGVSLSTLKYHKHNFTNVWQEGYNKFRTSVEGELMSMAYKRCKDILVGGSDTAASQLIKSIMFTNRRQDVIVSGSIQHDISAFDHLKNDELADLIKNSATEDVNREEDGTGE